MRALYALFPAVLLGMASLRPELPKDVGESLSGPDTRAIQRAADSFAWDEFIALSWPARADRRGEPDTSKAFGAEGLRVWETWKSTEEIFLPGGAEPPDWNSPLPRERHLTENLQAVQSDGTLPATLTDRYGHVVRYEVRVNRVLFDYLRTHKLYDSRQQEALDSVSYPEGAIAVKASWRELEPGEEAQYLTRECVVFDTKNGKPGRKRSRKMGLVGLHIVQKTPSAPQWVWATFEHMGNTEGEGASFCPPDTAESRVNLQTRPGTPNLVRRLRTPSRALVQLNHRQQQLLHATQSPLQNYELVGAQWPGPGGRVEPTFLSNTTMESFVQESSCLGCHAAAGTLRSDTFVSADFLYLIRRAKPEHSSVSPVREPRRAVTAWERQNWRAIQRGYALSVRTYELLPKFAGNRLHCGSCHLDVGQNLSSSPWIGMFAPGKYDTSQKFFDRINQCMQRSMNGKPLPTDGPEMAAFNAYFRWLDTQAPPPAFTGMPKVETLPGDPKRGKALFAHRCAACHGTEGQGRYLSKTYYRPALWGPDSFNNLAGLGAKPEKMAGFLKHNMPLGSGGSLTLQEAWDLTAFIGTQPRPVKTP